MEAVPTASRPRLKRKAPTSFRRGEFSRVLLNALRRNDNPPNAPLRGHMEADRHPARRIHPKRVRQLPNAGTLRSVRNERIHAVQDDVVAIA